MVLFISSQFVMSHDTDTLAALAYCLLPIAYFFNFLLNTF
jgi:hypothetical protein